MTLTRGFVKNSATTALDTRLMDQVLVAQNADGSARTGVVGPNPSILSTTSSVSPMTVNVAAAEFVCSKGKADGITRLVNDGVVPVEIAAAPVSNSRITVIWVKQNDDTTGDGDSLPVFGTTDGPAAPSPIEPAIPTGALRLGTIRVYSDTTASNGGSNVLTNDAQMTAVRGGVVPFRTVTERDAWTTAPDGIEGHILDTGAKTTRKGGEWLTFEEDYATLALASGWLAGTGGGIRYRKRGKKLEILPFELARSPNQSISPGDSAVAPYIVATIPVGSRPLAKTYVGVGTIGVAGNLGASRWFILPSGELYFNSLVPAGTMLTGGTISNHIGAGPLELLTP